MIFEAIRCNQVHSSLNLHWNLIELHVLQMGRLSIIFILVFIMLFVDLKLVEALGLVFESNSGSLRFLHISLGLNL